MTVWSSLVPLHQLVRAIVEAVLVGEGEVGSICHHFLRKILFVVNVASRTVVPFAHVREVQSVVLVQIVQTLPYWACWACWESEVVVDVVQNYPPSHGSGGVEVEVEEHLRAVAADMTGAAGVNTAAVAAVAVVAAAAAAAAAAGATFGALLVDAAAVGTVGAGTVGAGTVVDSVLEDAADVDGIEMVGDDSS